MTQEAVMNLHIACVTDIKSIRIIAPAADKLHIIEDNIPAVGNYGCPMCRIIDHDSIDLNVSRVGYIDWIAFLTGKL